MSMTGMWQADPFASFRELQRDLERVFERRNGVGAAGRFPPVNLWAGENSIAVTAEVPGVESDAIDVSVKHDILTIAGERETAGPEDARAWHRRERARGRFHRVVQLPFRVDPDKVRAQFRDGVLEIDLERPESDRPRRIEIQQ